MVLAATLKLKRALFIVDDRPEAGRGHVVRCGALANELRARGWECDFLAQGEHGEADVLVVDLYHGQGAPMVHTGNTARVVQIADKVSLMPTLLRIKGEMARPDLIVDGGAGAHADMYRDSGAREVLAGPEYALLRPEFAKTQWPLNSDLVWLDVRRFAGVEARQMACHMASAKVLITAAGMRAMEAACVGAPMILFVESDDQESNARALEAKCAGIIAYTEEYAQKQVKQLLKDPDWLSRMSFAGRSLVDGLGCKRVADAIERLVA